MNLLAQRATVEFEPERIDVPQIIDTIGRIGFEVPMVKRTLLIEGMT